MVSERATQLSSKARAKRAVRSGDGGWRRADALRYTSALSGVTSVHTQTSSDTRAADEGAGGDLKV